MELITAEVWKKSIEIEEKIDRKEEEIPYEKQLEGDKQFKTSDWISEAPIKIFDKKEEEGKMIEEKSSGEKEDKSDVEVIPLKEDAMQEKEKQGAKSE